MRFISDIFRMFFYDKLKLGVSIGDVIKTNLKVIKQSCFYVFPDAVLTTILQMQSCKFFSSEILIAIQLSWLFWP